MRTRSRWHAALMALLAVALLGGCGDGDEDPGLISPGAAGPPSSTVAAVGVSAPGPVLKAEKRWSDPKGNPFTILATLSRPSNAGLSMCSMGGGRVLGPSIVLSVRHDGKAGRVKGPQISVNDHWVAFPHGKYGCSFVFAPSYLETFTPGDSHTYRAMVVPRDDGRFADVVFSVTVPGAKKGQHKTTELFRVPAAKLVEAQRLGPPPGDPKSPTGAADHSHGG
jgi:hypothetical protein